MNEAWPRVRYFLMGANCWQEAAELAAATGDLHPLSPFVWMRRLAPERWAIVARSARRSNLPISLYMIPAIRSQASAALPAAAPMSLPSVPSTSATSSCAMTYWSILRCPSRPTAMWSALSNSSFMPPAMRLTPTGPRSSSMFIPMARDQICDGILRARYRELPADPTPLVPGDIYAYRISSARQPCASRRDTRSASRSRAGTSLAMTSTPIPVGGSRPKTDRCKVATQIVYHEPGREFAVLLTIGKSPPSFA